MALPLDTARVRLVLDDGRQSKSTLQTITDLINEEGLWVLVAQKLKKWMTELLQVAMSADIDDWFAGPKRQWRDGKSRRPGFDSRRLWTVHSCWGIYFLGYVTKDRACNRSNILFGIRLTIEKQGWGQKICLLSIYCRSLALLKIFYL